MNSVLEWNKVLHSSCVIGKTKPHSVLATGTRISVFWINLAVIHVNVLHVDCAEECSLLHLSWICMLCVFVHECMHECVCVSIFIIFFSFYVYAFICSKIIHSHLISHILMERTVSCTLVSGAV